jgi:hypothetical protein
MQPCIVQASMHFLPFDVRILNRIVLQNVLELQAPDIYLAYHHRQV